jgi:[acyl-carrier-protein] S-malonyltransferase
MQNIALIFPGQGSQKVGMGLEFFQNSPQAKAIFDLADRVIARSAEGATKQSLKEQLTKVIFEGPEEKLTSTAYCQPAIFTTSVAALEAFKASPKFKNFTVKFTAGHSLGEYAALYAAGVLQFEDALRLVQKRASLMEDATKQSHGTMAAVIGFDTNKLIDICRQTGAEVANFNSNEQVVISGSTAKVHAAIEAIKAACPVNSGASAPKVIPLAVSGAFHSSLMTPAVQQFSTALKAIHFLPSQIPVLSNVTGQPYPNNVIPASAGGGSAFGRKAGIQDHTRSNLSKQINSSVQWVKCVEYIASHGIINFIEIGPSRVLKGLMRRINPALNVFNIEKPQDIEALP